MNQAFLKSKKIVLDADWYLMPDNDHGVVLVFHEMRTRDKIEKIDGKQVKTGETEPFLFEEKYYYPRVAQALKEYVEETQNKCTSLERIIEVNDKIFSLIERIDKEFKQFK